MITPRIQTLLGDLNWALDRMAEGSSPDHLLDETNGEVRTIGDLVRIRAGFRALFPLVEQLGAAAGPVQTCLYVTDELARYLPSQLDTGEEDDWGNPGRPRYYHTSHLEIWRKVKRLQKILEQAHRLLIREVNQN
jgi:hypothetical protein